MKGEGLLARNWLKGSLGDAIHAVLFGAGHDPRLILAHLRVLLLALIELARHATNTLVAIWRAATSALRAAMHSGHVLRLA
jgi:transposase, IS5 family